jgi:hypothetical protein
VCLLFGRRGRDRHRIAPLVVGAVEALVLETAVDDRPVPDGEVTAAVLVDGRPDVDVVRRYRPIGSVVVAADEYAAAVLGGPSLQPVRRPVVDGDPAELDGARGDLSRADWRVPLAVTLAHTRRFRRGGSCAFWCWDLGCAGTGPVLSKRILVSLVTGTGVTFIVPDYVVYAAG